jgi:hypothetical protein
VVVRGGGLNRPADAERLPAGEEFAMGADSTLWDREMDGAPPRTISRSWLLERLAHAGWVRAIVALSSEVVALVVLGPLSGATGLEPKDMGELTGVFVVFGVPLLVCWAVTVKYCRRFVSCPHCGGSLWSCGTGSFKARRMRIKKDMHSCPHCRAKFDA